MRTAIRFPLALLTSALIGGVYGFGMRAVADSSLMVTMSIAFVFVVPVGIGILTGLALPNDAPMPARIIAPWLSVLIAVAGVWLMEWEGLICIVMLLPIALFLASLGGAFTGMGSRRGPDGGPPRRPLGAVVLLLPFAVGFVEERFETPQDFRTVSTSIEIEADVDTVWRQIVRVPAITPEERRPGLVHWMGFPYPVEATIDGAGVGAVRHASFTGGILFQEVVTDWAPGERLAFTIDVDAESVPMTTLDRHVVVGGEYFDVLTGRYRIEVRPEGGVVLHLESDTRVSTRFNPYSSLWTDAIMASIQDEILAIIRDRCERG